ncbi:MAG: hypothetical protein HRU17_04565 [Polyangiaceae bacterium]|nr:hypothetical protein [Polyangiaceae bacterium]
MYERVALFLASPKIGRWVAVIAMLLTLVSVTTGLATEDRVFKQHSLGMDLPRQVNLYGHDKLPARDEILRANMDNKVSGFYPWITHHEFGVSFWRPLSSWTHHLDYHAWPDHEWLMHLQSVLWYGSLAAAAALLFREVLGHTWVAGLAALLYAIDDAHGHAVGWLANRNTVLAALFGVLAIWSHIRWRKHGSRKALFGSIAALSIALGCAEFALGAVGYLVAHNLTMERGLRTRCGAALPWLGVVLGWALIYRELGHYTFGSGLYVHPLREPFAYAKVWLERPQLFLFSQFAAPFSGWWLELEGLAAQRFTQLTAAGMLAITVILWPMLREQRESRFFALGMVGCLPPICATFPEDRLLFFVGIGAMALVAQVLERASQGAPQPGYRRLPFQSLAAAFAVLHLGIAPVLLPFRTLKMDRYDSELRASGDRLYGLVDEPSRQSLMVLNSPDYYYGSMTAVMRLTRDLPIAKRLLFFCGTLAATSIETVDRHTIIVRPTGGFFSRAFNRIYRGEAHPLPSGTVISLRGVDITVLEATADGSPLAASFRFAYPLNHPNLVWAAWRDAGYERIQLPPRGERITLRGERP